METLGQWLRASFDKFLLAALFAAGVVLVLHMSHDKADTDVIGWAREQSGTVLGALLGLITGRALAGHNNPPPPAEPPK